MATLHQRISPGTRRSIQHFVDLARVLLGREIKVQYKTTALGVLWGFANPLLQLLVYSFLFSRVISLEIPNYGLFLFVGILSWGWFQGSIDQSSRSITEQGPLVRQPGFPVMVLPVVAVAAHLVNLLLALPLFFVFALATGVPIHASVVFLPLLLVLQFLFIMGPAYLVGACNVVFRDTARIAQVGIQLMFFLTPVFYGVKNVPDAVRSFYVLNPMATLINAYRDVLIFGNPPDWGALGILLVVSSVCFWAGFRAFQRMKNRFAEEIG